MDITGQIPSPADVDAIITLVATVEEAQGKEDADAFLALIRDDAVWVTGHGKRLYGRDTIAEFTRRVLPGATKDSYSTYSPDHLLFLRPDIAVVNVNQKYALRPGATTELSVETGSPVYFLAKNDGAWRIAAAQNTVVVPEP
ncbi:SgcJ/EcaC family oxidoreductase [Streptomyces sp. SID13031]|uniref:SgcJ/EcaC family oxidoreductase n=1 Tax=Streptomyces sp. SID13031 TaxID=2706046 RepID=UPI0013C8466A|nr:SgcJ/EcaC family oxidoreductase [Streptomyces sp. SID13031]NEA33958.1 SgcJ/EcaC family oxidoreductase [Streptomyces sp. SID13031]